MVASAFIPRFPSRPFPAKEWLKKRAAASSAATPPPQAAAPVPSDEMLDLALLASCLPKRLYGWLIVQAQPLAVHYQPPRQRRGKAGAPGAAQSLLDPRQTRLGWLRARLGSELAGGLAITATPLWQLNRPVRNRALVAHAEAIGQLMDALGRQPGADPPEQELARALAGLGW